MKTFAVAVLLVLPSSADAALIVNGSFEQPALPPLFISFFTSIPGWTATTGEMEIQHNAAGIPFDGNQLVELDAFFNGAMEQIVPTSVGQGYRLEFAYSPRPRVSAATNGIDVFWDGNLLASLTGTGASDTNWTVHSFNVTALSDSSILAFAATGTSDSFGGYLDAVSLQPVASVPEPSAYITWLLIGLTIIGGGYWWRRKKA